MITSFDHFIILVNDLDPAMEKFRRLGFAVAAGGEHPTFGSHNALIAFADGAYLELLAFKDKDLAAKSFWGDALKKMSDREGLVSYALLSNDLARDVASLRARGITVSDPQPGARVRPDGQRVAWQSAILGETRSGILPFLIQDETPREMRIESARNELGAQARVKEIVVAADNVERARDAYHALLEVEPKRVQNTGGDVQGYRFTTAWGAIVLAHPTSEGNAMADQLAQRGEGLYSITLVVNDFNRSRSAIVARGARIEEDARGFLIAPDAACGARIRLVP